MTRPDRCADSDPSPNVLKLMLDTNVIDELMANPAIVSHLRRATETGAVELLITHVQIDEVLKMGPSKRAKREALVQILAAFTSEACAYLRGHSRSLALRQRDVCL